MNDLFDRLTELLERLTGGRTPSQKNLKSLAIVFTVVFGLSFLAHRVFRSVIFGLLAAFVWLYYFRAAQLEPGHIIRDEKKDVERFATDPKYREMVLATLKQQADDAYEARIREAEAGRDRLLAQRENELKRLTEGVWRKENSLKVNSELGLVRINGQDFYFDSIDGAEVTTVYAQRFQEYEHQEEESHRKLSVGGAIAGGIVGGALGAAVGAAVFSKKEGSSDRRAHGEYIPTCSHIGVKVRLDGFAYEIPILDRMVDQGTPEFNSAMMKADRIVATLSRLAHTPVPESVGHPENAPVIRQLDGQIRSANQFVSATIAAKPTYELPERYQAVMGNLQSGEYE